MKRKTTLLTAVLILLTFLAHPIGMMGQNRTTVTDELTRDLIGVTGTTYTEWSDVTSNSDAVYAGQTAGGNDAIQLRSNNSNSGIVTTASGGTVTSVSVTWNTNSANNRTLNIYGSNTAYSSPTELYAATSQGTLLGTIVNGTSTSLAIDGSYAYLGIRSASGALYLDEIDITWSTGGTPPTSTVETPTFSPAAGMYTEAQQVTIACATTGATIYYTLDGTTPTASSTLYASPITISETTTVKAIAVKEGMNNSAVASATYTIQQTTSLTTIASIWDFAESVGNTATPTSVTFNNWYVTGVRNSQVCISDGQYGFVIYQSNHGFTAGDKLNGTVACNALLYQNHYAELTGVTASNLTVTPGQEMPLLTTTIGDLGVRNYGTPLNLGTLTYNGTAFEDASGASITPYNNFNLNPNPITSLEANKQYNVKGVSIIYWQANSQTQQIAPRTADDFEEIGAPTGTVATPTFSPAAGTYSVAQTVSIATTTAGATIYYTLDGNDPSVGATGVNGTQYTGAITISETTTVKAIAVKEGMNNSSVASAVYTIESNPPTPGQETAYTLITSADALVSGEKYIVVGVKSAGYKAMGRQNTNNRIAVDVTRVNNTITVVPAAEAGEEAVYELTLGQENGLWTLYDAVNEGYLYAGSSSTNQLRTQAENDANGRWTIEIANDGVATIVAQGENTRNKIRLNNNGTPFSCYASGQLDVYLYKAGEVPTPPNPPVNPTVTIAEARDMALNSYATVQGVVTFIDGRNVYIQDATAGIDLFLNANTVPEALALGDMVQAYGKRSDYKGLAELSEIDGGNAEQFSILSSGNQLPLAVKTIAEILDDYEEDNLLQSTRVQIVGATIGEINTSNNTPITQNGSTLNIYKMPVVDGLEEGDLVTVTGVIGCFNNPQFRIAFASDVEFTHPSQQTVATPTFSPAAGTYYEAQTVTIACATTGATIYYTLDGSNPTVNSTVYTAPITVATTTTIKAFAVKENMNNSVVATAVYTITEAPVGGDFVRIADLSQLGNGAQVVFAARYNTNASEYYAMTAQTSGKPTGVLFTSMPGTNGDLLPTSIVDEIDTYVWTVTTDGSNYTFTNADGNVLGYSSSTNFATGGDNTNWTIEAATSEATAMVPNYTAFNVVNANVTNRAFALNSNYNFGPYHIQNMASESYNFFIDIFTSAGGPITPTCAIPTFSPEGGNYSEAQMVTINCSTTGATIYYTVDGSNPTPNSLVYTEPIMVAENTTIKAYAVKEGFNDSNIAEATYIIQLGVVTIFFQDWEGEMNGWTFVTVEGSKPWTIGQYQGNHYANANGYNGGFNEQWCISPAFSLEQYSNVSLTFMNAMNYTGPALQLFFSNDYDGEDPTTATWSELGFEMSPGSYTWTESGTISLADFTGTECYIGFMYTSTDDEAAAWEVDDILLMGYTYDPYLNVTPNALSGFTYMVDNGPSAAQTFTVSGANLPPAPGGSSGGVTITCNNSHYEFSLDGEEYWHSLSIEVVGALVPTTVYVRLEDGLPVGQWNGVVTLEDGGITATVTLSGTVTEPSVPGGDWNRISALSDLHNGDHVIIASRYDATVGNGYYAMTAGVSGKPDGVLFTSVNQGGVEKLPSEIADDADTYFWIVTVDGDVITLTNVDGDMLGYSTSTNFAGNTSTDWTIAYETSGDNAMVPNYTGFLITNAETTNRCIVMNANYKFGAYHTNNINSADYNFYLDLFVQGGSGSQAVATPVFSVASGTYYEELDVEITCATNGATIYYTTDGTDPSTESTVYTEPIHVDGNMTLKAFAVKQGLDDSNVAIANYTVITNVAILLDQDWEGEMDGWTFVTVEGNKPWSIGSHNGNQYAYANGYNDDTDNEQWCISPSFDLTMFAGRNVTLTFMNAMNYSGPEVELFFTNDYDGQDPESASWVPLSFEMSTGGYAWTSSGPISLNAFNGSRCNIGFRYTSTVSKSAAAWEIDDILLTADIIDEPYLLATPNELTGFRHFLNMGPSEIQTFVLSGGLLPTDPDTKVQLKLIDALNEGFLISDNGVIFSNMLSFTPVNGALQPTIIYVRLDGHELGTFNSTVFITCEDLSTQVNLEGEVLVYDGIGENLAESIVFWNSDQSIMLENHSGSMLQMVVYNLLGQPVMSHAIDTGSATIAHNLATGLYVVTLQNGKESLSVKMIVK